MKRVLYTTLFLLAMLISLVGTAAAAPMTSGNATLIGAGYVEGKGVVFTFQIDGKFSKSDMKGSVHVDGGGNYGLDCVKVDSETVKCTAPKAVAGNNVVVTWGGSTFWTYVPPIPVAQADTQYCYSIWDWWLFTGGEWTDFGPHCQDEPAQVDDEITYTPPELGGIQYPVWFSNGDDPECDIPPFGPAYYYDACRGY